MHSLDDRKRALRAEVTARRLRPGSEVQVASQAVLSRLLSSGLFLGAPTAGLYLPLPSEVQTAGLARALEDAGTRVVYPVVGSREQAADTRSTHSVDRLREATDRRLSLDRKSVV